MVARSNATFTILLWIRPLMSILIELTEANCLRIDAALAKARGRVGRNNELKAANLWGKGEKEDSWMRISVVVLSFLHVHFKIKSVGVRGDR